LYKDGGEDEGAKRVWVMK